MDIQELYLKSNKIREIEFFYKNILGFKNLASFENKTVFKIGASKLIFENEKNAKPYHFAFNIPSNKMEEAWFFLSDRLELLQNEEGNLFHFDSWNAQAIYFHDSDGNIVEFIARKNADITTKNTFSIKEVLNISEIGIATLDVQEKFNFLNEDLKLVKYSGDYNTFCATGDENGLFILIQKERHNWFPINETPFSSPFKIKGRHRGKDFLYSYKNDILQKLPIQLE